MSEKYAPGTVATATVRGRRNVRVMWTETNNGWVSVERVTRNGEHSQDPLMGRIWHPCSLVTDIRPLVVLDLVPHEVTRALEALRESRGMVALEVARKLESASRPAEPTGLGAVVEDNGGWPWVRVHGEDGFAPAWEDPRDCERAHWRDIDAVKVLSEGVKS